MLLWFAIGYRFAALKRGSVRDVRSLVRRYDKGKLPSANGVLSRALRKGIELRDAGKDELRPWLDDAFFAEEREIRKFNRLIITIVSAAPLLGLLGTVLGMIDVFAAIVSSGVGNPGVLAGGISKALITTAAGLSIAIPTMIFHQILSSRVDQLILDMEDKAVQMVDVLHQGNIS